MLTLLATKLALFGAYQFFGIPPRPREGTIGESTGPLWKSIKNNYEGFSYLFGKPSDPRVITALVIKAFVGILGLLFLCLVVYAGFMWMTAAGEEEKIRKAKSTLVTGVIGMGIVFAAYAITQFLVWAFNCAVAEEGSWCLFFSNLAW